jgi:dTDP-glucose pyrophosphorylase
MEDIILHGGHGTRLRPLTHTGPKQFIPVINKPISQHALEDLIEAGINVIGTLRILRLMYDVKLIDKHKAIKALEKLKETGFRISEDTTNRALRGL